MTVPPPKNIICLSIDRLHAGYVGAYGNTWINTPALDRLAAESFVLDRAIVDSPRLDLLSRSFWIGLHAMAPADSEGKHKSLIEHFAGRKTVLLSDDVEIAEHPLAAAFSDRMVLKLSAANTSVAASVEDTQAAEFFAAAADQVQQAKSPFLLWLHTGTLGSIWDAPLEFRERYRDEDDPPAQRSAAVPNQFLSERFDPDELLAITHAYAGQVTLLDELISTLMASIDEAGLRQNTLLVIFSPRSFPLGEHRRAGPCDDALYAELTHVPCMLRFPDGLGAADRTQALVQPPDLPATILDWAGLTSSDTSPPIAGRGRSLLPVIRENDSSGFDRACIFGSSDQKAIVTPAWSLRISNDAAIPAERHAAEIASKDNAQRTELFAKPDDWFEVNELTDRCPEVVEQLQSALTEFETACKTDALATLSKLPSELIHGIE